MSKILISGGSGLVGRAVTRQLLEAGHEVVWLSRKPDGKEMVPAYRWDPAAEFIEPKALHGTDHLIHLAGASIIGKRWSKKYKEKIIASRVRTAELLFRQVIISGIKLKSFTGASAVGYYGPGASGKVFSEEDKAGSDFLARVCVAWERSYEPFRSAGVRTTILRTAIVLDRNEGALAKMLPLFRLGLGAALGSGAQPFPWVHIEDLAAAYLMSVKNGSMHGIYNVAAPHHVNNGEFSRQLAASMRKPLWLPNVPHLVLRVALGEAATTLTTGAHVRTEKIMASGFNYRHPELRGALQQLLVKAPTSRP